MRHPLSRRLVAVVACAALLLAGRVSAQSDPTETSRAGGAPTTQPAAPAASPAERALLAKVLTDLVAEGSATWFRNKTWPRHESNYAQVVGKPLPNDDLVRLFTRRINTTAAVDAYMKWQLLSFNPDFSRTSPDDLHRIIAVLPELTRQPDMASVLAAPAAGGGGMNIDFSVAEPVGNWGGAYGARQIPVVSGRTPVPGTGGSRPTLDVVSMGTGLDASGSASKDGRYVDLVARVSQAELIDMRRLAVTTNLPVLGFRDGLAARLPEAGAMRLAATMADVRDRIRAGDPSTKDAVEKLIALAKEPLDRARLSERMQRQLIAGVYEIARARCVVVTEIGKSPAGKTQITRELIAFPREQLPLLMSAAGLDKIEIVE